MHYNYFAGAIIVLFFASSCFMIKPQKNINDSPQTDRQTDRQFA